MLWMTVVASGADTGIWGVADDWHLADLAMEGVRIQADSAVVLAPLADTTNLALGMPVIDDFGRAVPLSDGGIDAGSEWVSGTPNVFGRHFIVDLGRDRAVVRVRILAGQTARRQPEYYMRGYRIEVAAEARPDLWRMVAESRDNAELDVDTRSDSTWLEVGADGEAVPKPGRFLRVTIIRQDRSNWVALGEIQVFGTGFVATGSAEGRFAGADAVNVGRIRWEGAVPEGTRVDLQFREVDAADGEWTALETADGVATFAAPEPVRGIEYRAVLQTEAPLRSPSLRRLTVEYDPVLVAAAAFGSVAPSSATKGERLPVTYTARVEAGAGDYGVDLLRVDGVALEIDDVRIDGRRLEVDPTLGSGLRWAPTADQRGTVVELAPQERIVGPATVEIDGDAVFLEDQTAMRLAIGNRAQWERDGYPNWQQARQDPSGTWEVEALGTPPRLLGEVEAEPRPFSPFRDGTVRFRFTVGNVREDTDLTLTLYTLDGRRVRRLTQTGQARVYHFEWDGRDGHGQIVEPGLYLYVVRVKAGDQGRQRRGTCVVAY